MLQKPKLAGQLYQDVFRLFTEGKVNAGPCKIYPVCELANALTYLSKGQHIGKVIIKMDEQPVEVLPADQLVLDKNGTYVVTGGASGFGLELAKWLAAKGAGNLVLLSRSGCKTDYDHQTVANLKEQGVNIALPKADITDFTAMEKIFDDLNHLSPLKGVIHSAAVLEDGTIPNMDEKKFMKVFEPKVLGAWNMHKLTLDKNLDFFVMLSSISSVFGLPGQSNYSSANNFLDRLARHRQNSGLAGSSVNLGVLGMYAGMSKEGGQVLNVLANQGWIPLTLEQVTSKIENIILNRRPQRMAANIDWKRFREFFSHLTSDSRFAHLLSDAQLKNKNGSGNGTLTLADQVLELQDGERQTFLQEKLAESLAKILGTTKDKIDVEESISKIGLDSLMLNQLRNWIQQKLEVNYPLMKIAKGPSIEELSAQLLEELSASKADEVQEDTSGIDKEDDIEVVNNWLIRNKRNPADPKLRLFCIHPVGAGASMFSHFIYHPPKDTDVMAFQLPGRENRIDEPPYEDIHVLIEDMAEVIKPFLDKPFAVYGHSFGGIVGFELIRYLRNNYGIKPVHFFASGTIAPQLTRKWKERDVISETAVEANSEEKLLSLMTYIDDADFLKKILPVMRKDMPIIMGYPYKEDQIFDFPITAFGAEQDEVVYLDELEQWREQTSSDFYLEVVQGDHWFLSRNKELILKRVEESLKLDAFADKDV